jgi:hypothetical protein
MRIWPTWDRAVLGPHGRGLLGLGLVVGVGGDAWVDAGGQALFGGDPAQQVDQPMALGLGQPGAELRLVVGGDLHQPVEQPEGCAKSDVACEVHVRVGGSVW